ncbi:MAG: NPCBM/NEW2 domain-containing protein [bacterium]
MTARIQKSKTGGLKTALLLAAAMALPAMAESVADDPVTGDGSFRGSISRVPPRRWEDAFVSGNGRMGAMLFGSPGQDMLVANHCRLFLPQGSREIVPDLARHVPELRRIIREKNYGAANAFFLGKAKEQGFPGLIWTDKYHPGFRLSLEKNGHVVLDGSRDVYVDLLQADRSACGWGAAKNGATVTGAPLRMGTVTFAQGIGTHASAEIVYDTQGKYRWLTFHAGISAEMAQKGSAAVQVWLDGKLARETPVLRVREESVYVSVPLAGARSVRIVATDGGDGNGSDHVCLGNLRLAVGESEPAVDGPAVASSAISDYVRTENFATGEVVVRWTEQKVRYVQKMFVSRTDNVIVLSLGSSSPGAVSCNLRMEPVESDLVAASIAYAKGLITCHNTYRKGKGGYDGVVRVDNHGGTQVYAGDAIKISNADEVVLLMRLAPWKTPLPKESSEAWAYSPENPDFADARLGVYQPAPPLADSSVVAYRTAEAAGSLLPKVCAATASLPTDYGALFAPHAAAHGALFNRVTLDLGGGAERAKTTEELLGLAKKENVRRTALMEKMYHARR